MENLASKLIVDVEQYCSCAQNLQTACTEQNDVFSQYIAYMKAIQVEGFKEGKTAVAFSALVEMLASLDGDIADIGKTLNNTIISFLNEIDDADSLLFQNVGHKPFTDQEFDYAKAAVDSTPDLTFETIGSWLSSLVFDKLMKLIWKLAGYKTSVENSQSVLAQKMEEVKSMTGEELTTIKINVRMVDHLYQQKLKNIESEIKTLNKGLTILSDIMLSEGGDISQALYYSLQEWSSVWNTEALPVTDADVVEFAAKVLGYFDRAVGIVEDICENSLGQLITTDFDRYRAIVNQAKTYFDEFSENYVQSKEQFDDYKSRFDKILELYNTYGSKWAEHFNGEGKDVELFNKIVKRTGEISGQSDAYIDIWFSLFCDMSDSREAFLRFQSNCDIGNADEVTTKALERLEAIYDNVIDARISETLETIAKTLKDKAVKETVESVQKAYFSSLEDLGGVNPVSYLMKKFVSSFTQKMFDDAPAVALLGSVTLSKSAFDSAVKKLRQAKPTDTNYSELIKAVRETFDKTKADMTSFFQILSDVSEGQAQRYYDICLDQISTMSLDDVEAFALVSPSEYYGEDSTAFCNLLDGLITVQ